MKRGLTFRSFIDARRHLDAWLFLLAALSALPVGLRAQAPAPSLISPRLRIVVFQFTSVPDDSTHRALAASVARSIVQALVADSTFLVMAHPRAEKNPAAPGADARYGIVGAVAEIRGRTYVDLRVVGLQEVQVLVRESMAINPAAEGAVPRAAKELAGRIRDHLTHTR